jgi:DNA-binding transcriptional LysR family regulator
LMVAGLGWGGLPKWMIHDDVAEGRLVVLDLEPYPEGHYSLFALHMADHPLGPAAKWWIERFTREMESCNY